MAVSTKKSASNEFQDWLFEEHGTEYFTTSWFNRVNKNHEAIRDFIGGTEASFDIDLSDGQKSSNSKNLASITKELKTLLPYVDGHMGGKRLEDALKLPTVQVGNHNSVKISKILTKEAAKKYGPSSDEMRRVSYLVSQLGNEWAMMRTKNGRLNICISTEHKAFVNLGHYGCDSGSCFASGGGSEVDKYILAQSPNTFVVLISEGNSIITRFWGFATNKFKDINFSNMYMAPNVHEGNIIEVCHHAVANLMGLDSASVGMYSDICFVKGGIYHNDFGRYTFTKNMRDSRPRILLPDFTGFTDHICCPMCGEYSDSADDWQLVDNDFYCPMCIDSDTSECEYSGTKTFEIITRVFVDKSKTIGVKRSLLDDFTEGPCGHYYDQNKMSQCPACGGQKKKPIDWY